MYQYNGPKGTKKESAMYKKQVYLALFVLINLGFLLTAYEGQAQGVISLPWTGQSRCYNAVGTEISCDGTGQDGEFQAGADWPGPRFTVSGDCVTDNMTGLKWSENGNLPNGTKTWQGALDYVASMNSGSGLCGYKDWRLPNINELESLFNAGKENTATWLNEQGFYNVQFAQYWSSTKDNVFNSGFSLYFNMDGFINTNSNSILHYVWPVRSGSVRSSAIWKTGQTTIVSERDDGDLRKGVAWPFPRFVDHLDGTVTDKLTGLMWTKTAGLPINLKWEEALEYVKTTLNTGGYTDWRIPNRKELLSLIDHSKRSPALPENHPFWNVISYWYWSSTTNTSSPVNAWLVDMGGGFATAMWGKNVTWSVWPVRGGGGSSGYTAPASTVYGWQTNSAYSKDPVNTANGNYVYGRKDIEIPGRGFPFAFERTYNSLDDSDGPLGFGWNHTYNSTLTVNGDSTVTIRHGDGKTQTWTPDGSGGYTPQSGVFDTLINNGDGTFTLRKKDQTRYNFNTSGMLSTVVDKNSNTLSLAYTGNNLTQITDTSGRNVTLTYNGDNRITLVTDPIGRTVQFAYDGNGNLTSATDMRGNATTYTYDANHQMLTFVDPRSNTVVTNVYDSEKRVTTQRDAKMGLTTFTYDIPNRTTIIVDQGGFTATYCHDSLYRLIQETDPLGKSTYYTYDSAGNRTGTEDKNGNVTQYTYDAMGNVLTKTDALNNVTTITYDAKNNPLTRTDALANTTTLEYDANGNLTKTTDPLSNFTTATYNSYGRPLTTTDARSNTTTYAYDVQGNLTNITDALTHLTTFTHDGVGRRLTSMDALNRTTTYTYDANNNPLTVTNPLGGVTTYAWNGNNNKTSVTDPMTNTTTYAYDEKDLLTTITDPLGKTITYAYDALDRKTSSTDKRGNTTTYTYDAIGDLLSLTDPLANISSYTYDANGNRLTAVNPLGKTTTYTYDALNRVVSVKDPLDNLSVTVYDALGRVSSATNAKSQTTGFEYDAPGRLKKATDANGGVVTYTYDANGNRLTMTDPRNNTTTYTYDNLNRRTSSIGPLGGTHQYEYDAVGNRSGVTDPNGNTITYAYDNNNRLTTITYPDTSTVTFTYNANGNRTGMTDSLGTSSYAYDALNRMTSHVNPFGKTVGYGYDFNSNRTSLTYPGNKTVSYTYNAANRLSGLTDWLSHTTSYTYDQEGSLTSVSNANGTSVSNTYDFAGRLTGLSNGADGGAISSYTYTLDALGNPISVAQNEPLAPPVPDSSITYTYDVENRLIGSGITYDANGNMTAIASNTFTYDFNNRLSGSSIDGVAAQYDYDGLGNRLSKTTGGTTGRYVLDVSGNLSNVLGETNAGDTITAYYVYGLGLVSKVLPNDTAYYYHYDSRGSAIAMTDGSQNVANSYAYNVFGDGVSSGSIENPFRYVGRYGVMDEGNGLTYIRARYYSPELGRFLTKDPLTGRDSDSQSLNRYVYALNNPIRLIDVSGFSALEGGGCYNAASSSDYQHNTVLNDKLKPLRPDILKYQYEYAAALEAEAAYQNAWVNTLEGVYGALNTLNSALTLNYRGVASGLMTMTSSLLKASGMEKQGAILDIGSTALDIVDWTEMPKSIIRAAKTVNIVKKVAIIVDVGNSVFQQGYEFYNVIKENWWF